MVTGIVGISAVVIDGNEVRNARISLQSVADIAALVGAKEVAFKRQPAAAAIASTETNLPPQKYGNVLRFNDVEMGEWNAASRQFTAASVSTADAVRVTLDRTQDNGNPVNLNLAEVLGFVEADVTASAIAVLNLRPMCILALDPNGAGIRLEQNNDIFASDCTIWSNATHNQSIAAMKTSGQFSTGPLAPCAAGQAFGTPGDFSAFPRENCQQKADPLAARSLPSGAVGCDFNNITVKANETRIFTPGVYCGVTIKPNADPLTFQPGQYIFKDRDFLIRQNNEIYGQDVHFHFVGTAGWIVNSNVEAYLGGRESGPLAGFVNSAARNSTGTFTIEANSDFGLEGVVYLPNNTLGIGADTHMSVTAPWAGFVVKDLVMWANADITIHLNDLASDVPMPAELKQLFTTLVR